jgi:2-keto-4-pentenoate hydratase
VGPAGALAGLVIDLSNDGGQLVFGQVFETGPFRQVSSGPAVEVLVRAAPVGAVRVSEEGRHAELADGSFSCI